MAKNHVLSGHFLWPALCLCLLLGGGVLGDYLLFAVRNLPETGNRTAYRKPRVDSGGVRYPKGEQHPKADRVTQTADGKPLKGIYTAEIGVEEATGNNDGSRVGEYLRYCGLDEGYAWCAAFVSWCHGQAGYAEPKTPWSPALFPLSRMIWSNDSGTRSHPKEGDVFGIYYTNLKRIAHVGFVDEWDGNYCITVEGNSGPEGAVTGTDNPANPIRAGPSMDGVHRKRRPIRTIKAVARWTK